MNVVNAIRRCGYLAVALALVMLVSSFCVYAPQVQAAEMTIKWYEPAATLLSSDANGDYYKVNTPIKPDAVHFKWNFSNGLDRPIGAGSLQYVTLRTKYTNIQVPLDRGTPPLELDANGVMNAGDFKYTKLGGGDGTGGELRLLELILKSTTLQAGTAYIVELGSQFCANNDNTLGKTYSWEFTTSGQGDTNAPVWPQDSVLTASNITPTSLTLDWTAATDENAVIGYKILRDGVEAVTVDGSMRSYNITGLTPGTQYTFKVEAGDAAGNWSASGPAVTVLTEAADTEVPNWPEGSQLTCSNVGEKGVTLIWPAATDNCRVVAYKVYMNEQELATVEGTVTTYDVVGLTGNTSYRFKVEAGDECNNWSTNGPSLNVTTVLDATSPTWPEGSTLTCTDVAAASLKLEWTAAEDNIGVTSYRILRDSTPIDTVTKINTYTVTGLTDRTTYVFAIEAGDAAGNWSSGGPSVTVTTLPWSPTEGAGFAFTLTSPTSSNISLDETRVYNEIDGFVAPDQGYFCWDFSKNLEGSNYLQNVSLKKKDGSATVNLTAGNFKYTCEDTPEKIQRLELTLSDLERGACYVVELGPDLSAGDGTKLGKAYCWEFNTQPVFSNKSDIYAGFNHQMSIDGNGNVWAWGFNTHGQLGDISTIHKSYPVKVEGLAGVTSIACGDEFSLALKEDGTVWAWGKNWQKQLGDGTNVSKSIPVQVKELTGVRAIAGGTEHALAVKEDGTVWAWGYKLAGNGIPTQVEGISGVVAVAASESVSLALKEDGTVWAWGWNQWGALGDGTSQDRSTPVQAKGLSRIVGISCKNGRVVAVRNDGTVWTWGYNKDGSLGNGSTAAACSTPLPVKELTGVKKAVAGINHMVAVKTDGTVWAWGKNLDGQLGDGTTQDALLVPVQVSELTGIDSVAAGYNYSGAREGSGTVWAWGKNGYGQLGNGSCVTSCTPVKSLISFTDVAAPQWTEGSELTVSNLSFTSLTLTWPVTDDQVVPGYRILQDGAILCYVAGNTTTCNITGLIPGKEYAFGVEARDLAGNWSNCLSTTVSTVADITAPVWPEDAALACTDVAYSSLKLVWPAATDNVGVFYRLYCGEAVLAEVGSNTLSYCVTGLKASTEYTFRVEAGDGSGNWTSGPSFTVTMAVSPTQGAGFDFDMSDPVSVNVSVGDTLVYNRVHDLLDPKNVRLCWLFSKKLDEAACRQNLSLNNKNTGETITLAEDNLVFSNEGDQCRLELRPGSTTLQQSSDYVVELGPNFAAVDGTLLGKTYSWEFATWPQKRMQARLAAGAAHTLILQDDGTVFSCGLNNRRQLGNGTANSSVPVPVTGLSGIISVSAGDFHSVALKEDGTVWAWGFNSTGQLGNGTTATSGTPIQVSGITGAVGVVARASYTAVLKNDGTVWTFGQNNSGQLGNGTFTNSKLPVQVPGLKDVIALAAGSGNTMALKADGSLWAWGNNADGQLGDGTTTKNSNPVKIMDGVTAIAAGGEFSLALKADGSLWAWGKNASGQFGNDSTDNSIVPLKIETAPAGIKSIAAGNCFTAVCNDDGKIWMWGDNSWGQLGFGTIGSQEKLPVQIESLSNMNAIGVGKDHVIALKNDGSLWVWGKNDKGQLGNGSTANGLVPVRVLMASPGSPILVSARTNVAGTIITLEFDKAMADFAGSQPAFAVRVDDVDNPITEVVLKDAKTLELTLTNLVNPGNAVSISYTIGVLAAADGNFLGSFNDYAVINRAAVEITDNEVAVNGNNKSLAITGNTPDAVTLTVPQEISDAKVNLEAKLNAPAEGKITSNPLPELNISATTSISPTNPVQVTIPAGTTVSAVDSWDGTLNLPTIKANDSVTVTPDAGNTATVNRVIEIGCGDTALNFDKAVKIVIPGEKGKDVGFVRGGVFQEIDTILNATTQEAVDGELLAKNKVDGKQDQDNDLVIWTKHFTSFVTYTQTSSGSGGGGNGGNGDGSGTNKDNQAFYVEKFTLVKNSSSSYTLRFDLSNGMDRELPGNLSKVHVYKKSDRTLIPYTSYNYIKQGTKDNPPKIRRLELTYDNLFKDGESYLVEIDPEFTANNGNTFGTMYTTEFTIGAGVGVGNNTKGTSFGSAGGTLEAENAIIVIPAGAFNSEIKITVAKVKDISGLPVASGSKILGNVVEISADRSGEFNQPVIITLTFDKSIVELEKNRVSLYWLDEKTGQWNELENVKVDAGTGTVSGGIKHFTKFAVMAVAKDVKEPGKVVNLIDIKGHWAEKAIEELVAAGAISGYPDGTFKPNQGISRAEFASIVVKAFKLEPKSGKVFEDTANHWAREAIATAAAYGIVNGYSETNFGAGDSITREQMAAMMVRAAKLTEVTEGKKFADNDKISAWAKKAVATASEHQIITGYPDNTFRPQAGATRAEAVTVIAKAS